MSKWRMYGPWSGSSQGEVPGPIAFGLALMIGVSFALLVSPNDPPPRVSQEHQLPSARLTVQSPVQVQVPAPILRQVQARQNGVRVGDWRPALFTGDEDAAETAPLSSDDEPAIAIVIDDLGGDVVHTKEALALPANVTMSFLPYPDRSLEFSHRAYLAGHEVIVHLPMQPVGNENPGTRALMSGLSASELEERTAWALARVSDYDGVNNHMGSLFTASRDDLIPVMQQLKDHGLFFLDSRTTGKSMAEAVARESGLLAGARDVFLDDEQSADAVEHQLARAEEVARKHGTVIAIGHPHAQTLKSLAAWTKSLKSRGYRLLPVRDVLKLRTGHHQRVSVLAPAGNG